MENFKKIYFRYFLLSIFQLIIFGCSGRLDPRLTHIEEAMDVNPDSLICLLESMDPSSFNERSKAEYALLLTRAKFKNHLIVTDDSLISEALDYFQGSRYEKELMMSYYYKGEVNYYRGNLWQAMKHCILARKIALKMNDVYWLAKCEESSADIFRLNYNYLDEISARKKAIAYYRESGRLLNAAYAEADLAIDYSDNREWEKSKKLFRNIIERNEYFGDGYLKKRVFSAYLNFLIRTEDYAQASIIADSVRKFEGIYPLLSRDYLNFGWISLKVGKNRSVQKDIDKSFQFSEETGDTLAIYELLINSNLSDKEAVEDIYKKILRIYNREILNLQQQSVVRAEREMLKQEVREQEMETKVKNFVLCGVICVGVVIVLAVVLLSRSRLKRKEAEMTAITNEVARMTEGYVVAEARETELRHLLDEMEAKNRLSSDEIVRMRAENEKKFAADERVKSDIAAMFSENWKTINNLCKQFMAKRGSGVEKSLVSDIEREIRRLGSPKVIDAIHRTVDAVKGDLATRFKTQMDDKISVREYQMAVMLFARMNVTGIAVILGENVNTLYSIRRRLKQKILKMNLPDGDEFVREMEKDIM